MYIGNKKILAACVTLAVSFGAGGVHASQTAALCTPITNTGNNNFTMLDGTAGITGGTNDVAFTWDGTMFNASSDYTGPGSTSNATISSSQPFFSHTWVAHDVQVFAPGSYSFDSTVGGGNPETGTLTLNVGTNQLGMHMLFDWNGNNNIDVVLVLNKEQSFGSGLDTFRNPTSCGTPAAPVAGANCLWTGAALFGGTSGRPAANQVWMLASGDQSGGDGIPGTPMAPLGPFQGFNANFNFRGTLSPANGTCGPAIDTTPDSFSFTPSVTNAAFNTVYTSNQITVSGLGVTQAVPNPAQTTTISITGGTYSQNGAGYISTSGTVSNNDTVTVRGTSGNANGMTTSVTLTIGGVSSTFSISTPVVVSASGSNFTMLDTSGVTGGTNDVVANWDGLCDSSVSSTNFSHMTLSSVTPFFSYNWTAHHIRVFCPGTYTIDTTCTIAQLQAGTTVCNNPLQTNPVQTQQFYTFTVGAGQIGAHMLFDWNNATNIDVVEVWNQNAVFGPSPMYTGAGACNSTSTIWNLMSTDWDGDGINGGAMVDGAFVGFSANFNIRTSGTPLACSAYTPSVKVADPSNTAGCSISSRPSNGIVRGDWWLVAGFIAWLGAIFRRRWQSQT